MRSKRSYRFFLEDILESIDKIESYTKNLSNVKFVKDPKTIDAVIRNLEIIGEAAKHIPKSIRSKHTEIPWKKMIGLRNIISHEYFGVDEKIIWEIIKVDLPILKHSMFKLLRDEQKRFSFNKETNNS